MTSRVVLAFAMGAVLGKVGPAIAKCGSTDLIARLELVEDDGTLEAPEIGYLRIDEEEDETFAVVADLDGVQWGPIASEGNPVP